jgi:hypothetical protein
VRIGASVLRAFEAPRNALVAYADDSSGGVASQLPGNPMGSRLNRRIYSGSSSHPDLGGHESAFERVTERV